MLKSGFFIVIICQKVRSNRRSERSRDTLFILENLMNKNQFPTDTDGCHDQIFLNSAGSSLMPDIALKAMTDYLVKENQVGGYEFAVQEVQNFHKFYDQVAQLLNCKPANVAFANSATDAYAKALSSIDFKENDVILTTTDDYVSNQIAFLSLEKRFKIKIIRSKKLPNNEIDFDDFENLITTHQPKLVAATHIPTSSGLVQNVVKIGELCQKHNLLFLLDACQSVGQINVDVQTIKCDFLTATGRKFLRGPRGTGFLYVSDKVLKMGLEPLFIDLNGATWTAPNTYKPVDDAKRFESWEMPHAAIAGFTATLSYLNHIGIHEIEKINTELSCYFRQKLSEIDTIKLFDFGLHLSNIITFRDKTKSLAETEKLLKDNKICYSVATKNNAIIDFEAKNVEWAIRFSPHYFNTFQEIDFVVSVLKNC